MSKFRELVESIRNTYQEDTTSSTVQQSEPKYKFLTPEYKSALLGEIEERSYGVDITSYCKITPWTIGWDHGVIIPGDDDDRAWDAAVDSILFDFEGGTSLEEILDGWDIEDMSNLNPKDHEELENEAFDYVENQRRNTTRDRYSVMRVD